MKLQIGTVLNIKISARRHKFGNSGAHPEGMSTISMTGLKKVAQALENAHKSSECK